MSKPIVKDVKLPEYPSELLKLALDDLKVIKEDKRYEIDMELFHSPDEKTKKCLVNLSGAILANTLKANITLNLIPCYLQECGGLNGWVNCEKLYIIDYLSELNLMYVYAECKKKLFRGDLTGEEKDLLERLEEEVFDYVYGKDIYWEDLFRFKDFEVSYEFYSSVLKELRFLDREILGMKG